jgi:hypothetical protein
LPIQLRAGTPFERTNAVNNPGLAARILEPFEPGLENFGPKNCDHNNFVPMWIQSHLSVQAAMGKSPNFCQQKDIWNVSAETRFAKVQESGKMIRSPATPMVTTQRRLHTSHSQGTPSPSPSMSLPGQLRRKK